MRSNEHCPLVTEMGFLRLLTNVHVMAARVPTAEQAWRFIEELRDDARVVFASEPAELEPIWRAMTIGGNQTGHNFRTDTYLATFAEETGFTFVPIDRGFWKHQGLALQILQAEEE